jgi:hypothetical protein
MPVGGWRRKTSKILHQLEEAMYRHMTMLAGLTSRCTTVRTLSRCTRPGSSKPTLTLRS